MKIMFTVLALAALCGPARAGIEWTWVNGGTGTEQGTFITNGTMTGGDVAAGSYTIIDFTLTSSAYPLPLGSMSDGTYYTTQPDQGFEWDGAAPTVFWRSSGYWTNGINLFVTSPVGTDPDRLAMSIAYFIVDYDESVTFIQEYLTPTVTPTGNYVASETSSFGLVKMLYR